MIFARPIESAAPDSRIQPRNRYTAGEDDVIANIIESSSKLRQIIHQKKEEEEKRPNPIRKSRKHLSDSMEIRRSAANLLIQAAPRPAAGPAQLIRGAAAVGSAEGERRRLWRAGGDGEREVAVEPSDTDEPAEAQVHEEEQHRETAAQGDDGDRCRWESVAEEVEGERSAAQVQVLAGVSEESEGAESAGPRLPETAFAGGFGGDNGLYRCA